MNKIITPMFWRRFMWIEEVKHFDKDGNLLWESGQLPNMMHLEGEEYILQLAFDTTSAPAVPNEYYIGLDARGVISVGDTLNNITNEPTAGFAYERQPVSSTSGFSITTENNNVKASSSVVTFQAIGGSWGPITNAFLATSEDNTGLLISTAVLSASRTVISGETFSMRIAISLSQC